MNEWSTPVTSLAQPLVIKVNGKPISKPMIEEETSSLQAKSQPLPMFVLLTALTTAHKLIQEMSLFKQSEEAVAVSGWLAKEPYIPLNPAPDFSRHFVPKSMYEWPLTTMALKDSVFERLTLWGQEIYSQFSNNLTNISHSGPVLIVIMISMVLLLINRLVKVKTLETNQNESPKEAV